MGDWFQGVFRYVLGSELRPLILAGGDVHLSLACGMQSQALAFNGVHAAGSAASELAGKGAPPDAWRVEVRVSLNRLLQERNKEAADSEVLGDSNLEIDCHPKHAC